MLKLKNHSTLGASVIGLFLLFVQMSHAQSVTGSDASRQNTENTIAGLKQSGEYDSLLQAVKNARQTTAANSKTTNFADSGGTQNVIGETAKLLPSDGTNSNLFGFSVAVSGDTAIVGAYSAEVGANSGQGAAYIFVKSGTIWTQQAQLTASDGAQGDIFGFGVAISGDTAIVGSQLDDIGANSNQGSAYIFIRSGSVWTEQAKLTAPDGGLEDRFGRSVAIDGDTVIVGAPHFYDFISLEQGSAYIFVKSGTTWLNQGILRASDGVGLDYFGLSVAVNGDTAIVGRENDSLGTMNYNQGSAYVFIRSGAVWTQQAKLIASDGTTDDFFGSSVAVNDDTVLVGAKEDDINDNRNQGSAYVFTRSGTTWNQRAKLIAPDGALGDFFGSSVALSGSTAIVGGYGIDIGANGHQGAVYVFTGSGAMWTQQAKLIASDGALGDNFGASAAIDGSNIIVGAYGKNNYRGTAYVFQILSANVSGRVLTSDGRGLYKAIVTITDQQGIVRTAMTNPFGYYRLIEIETGATYTVSIRSKRFQFVPQVVTVNSNIADLDFSPSQ